MTLHMRNGARVVVLRSGVIEYRSVTGRNYRHPDFTGSYEKAAAWVRRSAWMRDARFITETN